MSSGITKYIINDIYDVIVILMLFIVYCITFIMQLVQIAFIIDSRCYVLLISIILIIFDELVFIGYGFYFWRIVVPHFNTVIKY